MVFSDLITMHKHFVMKPNPYIEKEDAEVAYIALEVA